MARPPEYLTGVERPFGEEEIIVSKTDSRGVITYANEVFLRVSQYTEAEIIGQPHNCIRHPAMPRCVFKLLWDTVQAGSEIFAYVINRAKSGDHYWVLAHVTPTFGATGEITGYHSNRRYPDPDIVAKVEGIYQLLLDEENKFPQCKEQMSASTNILTNLLADQGVSYMEFIFSLCAPSEKPVSAGAFDDSGASADAEAPIASV
ncbi:MAG: transcriptional regulator [Phycisphaerae bacterium]|nr:MAG: transcriptional regulator [Phycisphaerae bacterium]